MLSLKSFLIVYLLPLFQVMEYHAEEQDDTTRAHFRHIFRSQRNGGNFSSGQMVIVDEVQSGRG